jgi:lipopolysaccharide transport system ATP-binding protein
MKKAIEIEGLSKKFYRSHADRPRTFQELFSQGLANSMKKDEFWALRDVNLEIAPGKIVGVIGRNGSGKSSLLRLVSGVGEADKGRIVTRGRVGALIDLGAGFHPDLTGRENVFINGVVSGMSRRGVEKNFDSIVAFAELEQFIDSPLRIYSLGMQMRLAFSIAIHTRPSILLIDEVLAVGDIAFQNKCLKQIARFKTDKCAILLVSHNTSLVSSLCDEVLWLDKGEVVARGKPQEVVNQYLAALEAETRRRTPKLKFTQQPMPAGIDLKLNENRFGSLEMKIEAVGMYNAEGEPISSLESGAALTIVIEYGAPVPVSTPIFGVTIVRKDGLVCWNGSTEDQPLPTSTYEGNGRVILALDRLDLPQGEYFVDVGIYQQNWDYAYDYHWHVYPLNVGAQPDQRGFLVPQFTWQLEGRNGHS